MEVQLDIGKPFFSVIMAVYNSEKYIAEAIRSVMSQTMKDWELIIVDDASTDQSYEIALGYSQVDERIRVYKLESNHGPGFARNYAVKRSSGNWLAILDADDQFISEKLFQQYNFISAYNENDLILVGTDVTHISSGGVDLKSYSYPIDSRRLKHNLYNFSRFPPHSSIVYKESAFREVGGFNVDFLRAQDYDLWLRLSEIGEFASVHKFLVKYRLHDDGISYNSTVQGYNQYMYGVAANVCFKLRSKGLYDPSKNKDDFLRLMSFVSSLYHGKGFREGHELHQQLKHALRNQKWFFAIQILLKNPVAFFSLILQRARLIDFPKLVFKRFAC